MRYLSEDEATRMGGLGYAGELYEDLDGNLYGWVEGVDEWGNPIGAWQELSQTEVPALGGLGALYAAPDGTVYQVQGLAEEEEGPEAAKPAEPAAPGESQAPEGPGPGPRLHPRAYWHGVQVCARTARRQGRAASEEGRVPKEVITYREIRHRVHPWCWAISERRSRRGRQASEKAWSLRLWRPWRSVRGARWYCLPSPGAGSGGLGRSLRRRRATRFAEDELRGFAEGDELEGSTKTKNYVGCRG
jgi:hypothetical protein